MCLYSEQRAGTIRAGRWYKTLPYFNLSPEYILVSAHS